MHRVQTGAKIAPLIPVLSSLTKLTLLALTIILFLAPELRASITQVDYWRMGEDDPSDTPGAHPSTTTDKIGGKTLTFSVTPIYATVASSPAIAATGSSSAIHVALGSFAAGTAPLIQSINNNFGIEAWINPDTTGAGQ